VDKNKNNVIEVCLERYEKNLIVLEEKYPELFKKVKTFVDENKYKIIVENLKKEIADVSGLRYVAEPKK